MVSATSTERTIMGDGVCVCTFVHMCMLTLMHIHCTLNQNEKTSDSKDFPLSNYGLSKI